MKDRTILILAIVAVGLVGLALLTRRVEHSREQIKSGMIFPEARAEKVAAIEMIAKEDTVRLRREMGRWLVATEGDEPADTAAVRGLLEKLSSFDRKYRVSNNPAMQATFEVDDASGMEARLLDAQGKTLADFRLGKNGPDFRSQYFRPAASSEVYLIPEYLRGSFDVNRATWRERTIFAFDPVRVQRVFIQGEKESFQIDKTPAGEFVFAGPDSVRAKSNLVQAIARTLSTLRADDFPDSVLTAQQAGLAPPRQRVRVDMEDGGSHELRIGRETSGSRVYVARDQDETLMLLSAGRVSALIRDAATLREES
ncbi:MAG: DUF4340 domain-containing protein [Candidatus Eisenbacteria bacterium]|nr:DUF4340 domain-containing protein [Candidatus Eisenbacteria bacterium]